MAWGDIYCDSLWGTEIQDGWGDVYPLDSCSNYTMDMISYRVDSTLISIDQT